MTAKIKVKLTEQDIKERGVRLAEAVRELMTEKEKKSEATKKFSERIKLIETEIAILQYAVRHGYEWQEGQGELWTE
jgi:predicted  nucleic acid-binding Zn-ribbon protein